MLCFRKFPVAKKFMDKRGGGRVSRFSAGIISSHSTEKFRSGTFCASFIPGIEKFWMRGWWGGGNVNIFR